MLLYLPMRVPSQLYGQSLALLTDFYQLTMAYAAWQSGLAQEEAVFHLFYRKNPFGGGVAIAAGLELALDFMQSARFDESDLAFLGEQRGADDKPLFARGFLDYLRDLRLVCDVDAMPEGTAVFPHEPLLRVTGPIIPCMLLETPLLNMVNFSTLVATKAARVCLAARGEPVLEFGLRRAQGIDGALMASRAAYIGGCSATSNALAGKLYGIPVKGTHAHSWVMLFDDELESFRAYARALPSNCVFLVDTYDTLEGVRHAIEVGRALRAEGHDLLGIRLDSGDLAWLSSEARKLLDSAGFEKAHIFASNDLDETIIASLKEQGAAISVWGVGTKLVTAYDDAALGGVYKLSAVRGLGESWKPRIKLSEQAAKTSTPGILQVRRFRKDGECVADMIYDEQHGTVARPTMIDPLDLTRRKELGGEGQVHEDLLLPALRSGQRVGASPDLAAIRMRAKSQLGELHSGIKRFVNPHRYPVGLEEGLHELKTRLVLAHRGVAK